MPIHDIELDNLDYDTIVGLVGFHDENLKVLERELQVKLYLKNDTIRIEAENPRLIDKTIEALQQCLDVLNSKGSLDKEETGRIALSVLSDAPLFSQEGQAPVLRCKNGKLIYPKTANQAALVEAFKNNEIVFASGVAGTGKTYLAVA